jgi:cobalt-zinc-cadmium efflux system outer membrane protein
VDLQTETPVNLEDSQTANPIEIRTATLESLLELALSNNPALQQVRAAASKAAGIRAQVGLKPNANLGYFGQEIGNDGAGGQHGGFVSQTIVRGNKLAWNQQVIGHDVNSLRWQVQAQCRRVETDVRIRYYRALTAQQKLNQARRFRAEAIKAADIAEERLDASEGTRPDLLQSQILVDLVELTIRAAELDYRGAWQELAAVANAPYLQPAELLGSLPVDYAEFDSDALYEQIATESPLLKSAVARVDRARASLRRQRIQPIPNLQTQLGLGYDDSTGDDYALVQLSLPLPIHNKNQGNVSAAYAEYCEATHNVQRIRMQIRAQLADALRRYDTARARAERFQTSVLPKAEESLSLIQLAQASGEAEFLRVLTARQAYFEFNLQFIDELGKLAQIQSEIDGLLLTGGLSNTVSYDGDDGLRGQALSGQ